MLGLDRVADFIIDNVREIIPFTIIRSYQGGLRYTLGIDEQPASWWGRLFPSAGPLEPGLRWRIPYLQDIDVVDTVPDVNRVPLMSATLKDGRTVTFSAVVRYEIVDVQRYFTKVQDFDDSLSALIEDQMAPSVRKRTSEELFRDIRLIERRLRASIERRAKVWGVRVHGVRITNLVIDAQHFRHMGSAVTVAAVSGS